MAATTSYHKQTAQFLAIVGQNMPELSGQEMQEWITNPLKVKEALAVFQARLRKVVTTNLPTHPGPFVSTSYFQDRKGLYVWKGFKDRVVSTTQTVQDVPAVSVESFDLVSDSTDTQIRAELPENHVFRDPSIFCSHLAGMIDRQAEGKEGLLLVNDYANIFYVNVGDRVVAVYVYWSADYRGWDVFAYELDDRTWGAGDRVFSATAVA